MTLGSSFFMVRSTVCSRLCEMLLALAKLTTEEIIMWTKPEATEMRFGFEVTMYVCNR